MLFAYFPNRFRPFHSFIMNYAQAAGRKAVKKNKSRNGEKALAALAQGKEECGKGRVKIKPLLFQQNKNYCSINKNPYGDVQLKIVQENSHAGCKYDALHKRQIFAGSGHLLPGIERKNSPRYHS